MPLFGFLSGGNPLAVHLDSDPDAQYAPGDTISGHVVLLDKVMTTQAWLTIQLHGKSKSNVTFTHRDNAVVFEYDFDLFNQHTNTLTLFNGPLQVSSADVSAQTSRWPFYFTIPTHPDPDAARESSSGTCGSDTFWSIQPYFLKTQPLPPTFDQSGSRWQVSYQAKVEYYLEAKLRAGDAGKLNEHVATLPLFIRPLYDPEALSNPASEPHQKCFPFVVSSFQLENQASSSSSSSPSLSLSLGKRTQKLFGSSAVPRFGFSLIVSCPNIIHLEDPIPFTLLVQQNTQATSDSIRENVPEYVTIPSLDIHIFPHTDHLRSGCSGTLEKRFNDLITPSRRPVASFKLKQSTELPVGKAGSDPVDLSAFLHLQVHKPDLLVPSFTTFNIQHRHRVEWEIKMSVAGESVTCLSNGELSVVLMPPRKREHADDVQVPNGPPPAYPAVSKGGGQEQGEMVVDCDRDDSYFIDP